MENELDLAIDIVLFTTLFVVSFIVVCLSCIAGAVFGEFICERFL